MECTTHHQHFLSILRRCISILSKVMILICLQANIRMVVLRKHPHFSWPIMTPSQQHDAPMATPNAPLTPQWNVPGAIPDMGDLLGVDLRHEFSAEAEQ